MAESNFKDCLRFTLKYEGGYVDHPADPGGATNLGITIGVLRSWRGEAVTKADVRSLTLNEAGQIYKARYWDKVEGDKLPPGVDLVVFDYAVNSGPARAAKALQKVVGVAADGVIGMDTIRAVHARTPRDVIKGLCAERLRFVKGLRTWATFGKGWGRRISAVQLAALRMASSMEPVEVDTKPAPEKARVTDAAPSKDPAIIISGVGAAATAAKPISDALKQAGEVAESASPVADFVKTLIDISPYVFTAIALAAFIYVGYRYWKNRKGEV